MNTETKIHLRRKFKEYYWNHQVGAPSEVHRREFGVGTLEDKIKFRHKAFATERELNQYLKTEAPYYISYSAAYYEFPKQPMAEKNWLGADLIFDLDKPMSLLNEEKLEEVKEEATTLLEFLEGDFGFSRKDISVNFSGGKGYHIHVSSDDVKSLNGDGRREIADYVSGAGLDITYFLSEVEGFKGFTFKRGKVQASSGSFIGPRKDSRGWAGRVYAVTEKLVNSPVEELLLLDGIGRKTAEKIAASRERNMKLLAEGKWDALFSLFGKNIQKQIYSKAVEVTDEDKQVTLDTSRLIRLPDTIHGGSGLIAKKVADLGKFNPLVDALAFRGGESKVRMSADVGVFQIGGKDYGPYKAGLEAEVEECAAVYLMLKGLADVKG
ncbi:MAG: DNA primase catalytic subunit PriS [Candidatus Altiarchaeota archaeon]